MFEAEEYLDLAVRFNWGARNHDGGADEEVEAAAEPFPGGGQGPRCARLELDREDGHRGVGLRGPAVGRAGRGRGGGRPVDVARDHGHRDAPYHERRGGVDAWI